jgi:hypothetical protein
MFKICAACKSYSFGVFNLYGMEVLKLVEELD